MIERAVCLKLSLTAFLATFHAFRQHDSTFWSNDKDQAICGYKKWHLQATQELMCYQTFLSDFSAYRLSKTVIQHFEISLAVFQIAGQSHSLTVSAVPVSTYQAAFDVSFLPAVPAPSTSTTFDLLNGAEEADGFSGRMVRPQHFEPYPSCLLTLLSGYVPHRALQVADKNPITLL